MFFITFCKLDVCIIHSCSNDLTSFVCYFSLSTFCCKKINVCNSWFWRCSLLSYIALDQSVGRKWSKLVVVTKPAHTEKTIAERDRVLCEKVSRTTVPVVDPDTGNVSVQTTETVERIIEREVTFTHR